MQIRTRLIRVGGLLAGMLVLGAVQAEPPGTTKGVFEAGRAVSDDARREELGRGSDQRRYDERRNDERNSDGIGRRQDIHRSDGFRYEERRDDDRHYGVDQRYDKHYKKPKHRRHPPEDFRDVRIQIHDHRHYFGRGPDVRTRVIIVRGQPLPPGWGRRMTREQLHYLPYYHGYEWRRVGTDMILVELATNIVHEVLVDVLLDD